jgi:hypothetical protein
MTEHIVFIAGVGGRRWLFDGRGGLRFRVSRE